jgi:hypothetical protein
MSFWKKVQESLKTPEQKLAEAQELIKAEDPGGQEALEALLRQSTTVVRCRAAAALGEMLGRRAISALVVARTGNDMMVRQAANAALDKVDRNWRKLPEARSAAEYEIKEISEQLAPFIQQSDSLLENAVQRYDQEPVRKAVTKLIEKGEDLVTEFSKTYDLQLAGPALLPIMEMIKKAKVVAVEGAKRLVAAAGAAPPKPGDATKYWQKAKTLDVDRPSCFSCGKPLAGGESMLGGQGVVTFGISSRPLDEIKQDYRLFDGTICFKCLALFCLDCVGQPIDRCPQCRGKTEPATRRHLLRLLPRK